MKKTVDDMIDIDIISRDCPDDQAFAIFAACYEPKGGVELDAVRALIPQDTQLAEALTGYFGFPAALAWLDRKIDALDGHTARTVIASRTDGCRIVRSVLMRMP